MIICFKNNGILFFYKEKSTQKRKKKTNIIFTYKNNTPIYENNIKKQ
jgi:hypothetical protein